MWQMGEDDMGDLVVAVLLSSSGGCVQARAVRVARDGGVSGGDPEIACRKVVAAWRRDAEAGDMAFEQIWLGSEGDLPKLRRRAEDALRKTDAANQAMAIMLMASVLRFRLR